MVKKVIRRSATARREGVGKETVRRLVVQAQGTVVSAGTTSEELAEIKELSLKPRRREFGTKSWRDVARDVARRIEQCL